ncbi:hypothetical protein [Priestia taiwanensis]|uniref:Uncharacterized protein n=1 Tax=Priestia taiwanensis TaxID=1347902 RepID=A0A917EQW3_9BACI|nr:hypothetical protein [Priestia taiwanensis]MBM7363116.1 hypothetical protein [Priestia taiwanensis]GGE67812.1 hypothetical protein GCM10007140_17360 [Priestia taiwanensis]
MKKKDETFSQFIVNSEWRIMPSSGEINKVDGNILPKSEQQKK